MSKYYSLQMFLGLAIILVNQTNPNWQFKDQGAIGIILAIVLFGLITTINLTSEMKDE